MLLRTQHGNLGPGGNQIRFQLTNGACSVHIHNVLEGYDTKRHKTKDEGGVGESRMLIAW